MNKFLIIWLIVSILSGLFLNVKVNGEYIRGFKRFLIAFIVGFPFALIIILLMIAFVPMILILLSICAIFGVVKLAR